VELVIRKDKMFET